MNFLMNLIQLGLDVGILALCCEAVFRQKSEIKAKDFFIFPILLVLCVVPRVDFSVGANMTASFRSEGFEILPADNIVGLLFLIFAVLLLSSIFFGSKSSGTVFCGTMAAFSIFLFVKCLCAVLFAVCGATDILLLLGSRIAALCLIVVLEFTPLFGLIHQLVQRSDFTVLIVSANIAVLLMAVLSMAACLCLVVYAGIRLIPTDSPPDESRELPLLNAQFEGGDMGFEGLMLFDISESGSANPWTKDMVLETLPVYENLAYTDASGLPVYLSENELLGVAEDIAARLNADIISTEYKRVEDTAQLSPNTGLSGGEAWRLTAKTREHTILVSGNGNAVVEFNTQGVLFSDYTSENEAKTTIGTLLEKYASLLNVDEPVIYTWCDYTFTGEQLRRYFVYEDDTDPVQKILNYNFCLIGLTPSEEGGELSNVSFQNNLSSTNKIGDYPIITSDAAREMLLNGEYITTVPSEYLHDTGISEEMIAKEELVYRTENVNEIFMPYYRYYIELKESGVEMADGLKLYGVYYVPAVSAEYLVDFPIWDGSFN